MLKRIWIYYDGGYFSHVSEYYYRWHEKRARISIESLHELIRKMVSELENHPFDFTRVVDVKYFRGKILAKDLENRDSAYFERSFEDLLMRLGVSMYFSPVRTDSGTGARREKGVDVSLALEAFGSAVSGSYDVLVLIAGDGDYVPLVRKLNALWVRVMVLGWNFKHPSGWYGETETAFSKDLMREVIYPVDMNELFDGSKLMGKPISESLKKAARSSFMQARPQHEGKFQVGDDGRKEGTVHALKEGYGFLVYKKEPTDKDMTQAFFHESELIGMEMSDLGKGDKVSFRDQLDDYGRQRAVEVRKQ